MLYKKLSNVTLNSHNIVQTVNKAIRKTKKLKNVKLILKISLINIKRNLYKKIEYICFSGVLMLCYVM